MLDRAAMLNAMCLFIYLGSPVPLDPVPFEPGGGHISVEPVEEGAPIRARLRPPNVYLVGSLEQCGCGFSSSWLECQGLRSIDEARALVGAMKDDERAEFLAEQRSREQLCELVERMLAHGAAEIYACWAGDEGEPCEDEQLVEPAWIPGSVTPFAERTRYVLRRSGT